MTRVLDNSELFEQLKNGSTVVVPDAGFASNLKQQYSNWAVKDTPAWSSPQIFSWQQWLKHLWLKQRLRIHDSRIVLNDIQQRILWKRVIDSDIITRQDTILWNLNASISQARNAWALCHEYCLDLSNQRHVVNDVKVFIRWMHAYSKQLIQNAWLDPQQLAEQLISSGIQISDERVQLFGFAGLSPLQSRFFSAIFNQQVPVPVRIHTGAAVSVSAFADLDKELFACANWARNVYESNPDASIGVLVARLKQHANKVDSVFKSVFVPDYALGPGQADVFTKVQNTRLIDQGLIHSALNTLSLLSHRFSYEQFSIFLRDKFITREEHLKHDYSNLDVILRKRVSGDLNLNDTLILLKHFQAQDELDIASLIDQLQTVKSLQSRFNRSATILDWCDRFSAVLKYLKWPDNALLDSIDRELYRHWDQLFADICTAGLVHRKLTVVDALALFNDIAADTTFRVKPARITIADINEAGGMSFDAVWVCGLNDAALPGPVKLSPLLPFALQREHGLPYSTNEDCRLRADRLFAQLAELADKIHFSYYKNDEHTGYRASSYLLDFPVNEVAEETRSAKDTVNLTRLEKYYDDDGISFRQQKATGGSYLLKSQAQCPFKAYAEKRLNVEPIDARDHGLDSAERGNLVHRLLHGIWQALESSTALRELSEDALKRLICREVDTVVASLSQVQNLFLEVETRRLKRLSLDWLEMEKRRVQDFRVFALELPLKYSCEGLEFDLKVDRIDELEDGSLLVIDYKTGNSSKSLWLDKRLQDPQMPLYFFAHGNRAGALCFANTKNLSFDGVSEANVGIKGISEVEATRRGKLANFENWQHLIRHWNQGINTLVNEVKDGLASVTPDSPAICNFCGRQSLCRVNQHQSLFGQRDD